MRTTRRRQWAFARCAAGLCVLLVATATWSQARELSSMNGDEIKGLQQRLTDAGCYAGPVDGTASEALAAAKAACPDQEPVLRIETGMHVAPVSGVAADAQCRLAATSSDDKTVRLWSLPDGKLLRVLRPQIGAGYAGGLNAVAMSPDGRFVAAGGWDAHIDFDRKAAVSIFDTASGALVARAGAFENIVEHLAFSRDGRWLAVTLGDNAGLRIIDAMTWREVAADRTTGGDGFSAAFAPDGRLYTVANGNIRRYGPGPAFRLEAVVKTRGGRSPDAVAIDPLGGRIAVSFGDTFAIDLYDAPNLSYHAASGISGNSHGAGLTGLSWRGDGKVLIAAGGYNRDGKLRFLLFDPEGRRLDDPPVALASNTIRDIAQCADGLVVATADPAFGLIDASGRALFWRRGVGVDMREKLGAAFEVANDGNSVRFGLEKGAARPALFDVRRATLDDSPTQPPGLSAPIVGEAPPGLNRSVTIAHDEIVTSVAISPDRGSYVLGTIYALRKIAARGVVWRVDAPEITQGVNISADDRLIVAAYGDGTIRWHRVDDGRELLALFVNRDTKAWVAWTPSGYYMASPGGEDLIGWHVNRGWNQAADFFPASRFRDRFNRPDIVQLVLDTLDEDAAVKQANAKAHRREDNTPLVAHLPPVIRIADPPEGRRFATPEAKLDYVWRSPSGLPVDSVDVLIDDRPLKRHGLPVRSADANAEVQGSLTVALPPHDVVVGLVAYSGDIASEVARVKLTWTGAAASKPQPHRLHALIAGVSDYASPDMTLAYAAKDAQDFAHALEGQKGGYYSEVETRVIVDRDVTRASLIDGLDWLASQATSPEDVSVLFLSGHGLTDEKLMYWFLPSDATEDQAHGKGLSQDDVSRALRNAPGKVIWFLDTCHAGGAAMRSPVDVNTLVNTVTSPENGGLVTFASSKGNETSVESSVWKNGAFTLALVEGIEKGQAAARGDDAITVSTLDAYLQTRVSKLTDGAQHPNMLRPPQETDFTFAQARTPP